MKRWSANYFLVVSLVILSATGSPTRAWTQSIPYDYQCTDGDMRCLSQDIYRVGWCPITFKKISFGTGGEQTWYVSTDRGGGWVPVSEFYKWHDEQLKMQGSPTVAEMLDLWNGGMGADEVNACEHNHFWQCYMFRESTKGDLEGCRHEAKVEQQEQIAESSAAARARAREEPIRSEETDPIN